MDQLTALKIFVRVAETGSFSSAARQLNVSKSAVSKQISALEDKLGAKLLYRTTRQVSLTQEGQVYVERITSLLEDLDQADQAVSSAAVEPSGTLRINAPLSFGYGHIAPLLADFNAQYPKLILDLDLNDRFVDLVEEGYDLSVRIAEQLDDSSLIARRLAPVDMLLAASPAYLADHGYPKGPDDLISHACLRYRSRRGVHEWAFIDPVRNGRVNVRVKGPLITNNAETLLQAALDGMGICRLPSFTLSQAVQSGLLVQVMAPWTLPSLSIFALYPPNRHLSVKVRVFTDFLRDRFSGEQIWNLDSRVHAPTKARAALEAAH